MSEKQRHCQTFSFHTSSFFGRPLDIYVRIEKVLQVFPEIKRVSVKLVSGYLHSLVGEDDSAGRYGLDRRKVLFLELKHAKR